MTRLDFLSQEREKTLALLSPGQDQREFFNACLIGALSAMPSLSQENWERCVRVAAECCFEQYGKAVTA